MIQDIRSMDWKSLDEPDIMCIASVYHFFSIQFRENLEIACGLHPDDRQLAALYREECDTASLSPWVGIASPGEKMNHDEFVKRLLLLERIPGSDHLKVTGNAYLDKVRAFSPEIRAVSIGSYENKGLSNVFKAMLCAPQWSGLGPAAFKHFLEMHIQFDSDLDEGHGALSRHLKPDDRILPLWVGFRELLVTAVPKLLRSTSPVLGYRDRVNTQLQL